MSFLASSFQRNDDFDDDPGPSESDSDAEDDTEYLEKKDEEKEPVGPKVGITCASHREMAY